MSESNEFNNWHAFEQYACGDLDVWRQIEGRRIHHRKMGNGVVIRVGIRPGEKTISLWVSFASLAPASAVNSSLVRVFRVNDHKITDDFVDIDVPPQLAPQVSEVRQRLQQRLESEAERRRIGQLLKDTVTQLLDASIKARMPVPSMGLEDGLLVTEWLRGIVPESKATPDNLQVIAEHGSSVESYQLGRLLSARAAEIAAADFYRLNGMDVVDVSITQVREPESNEWRKFDLLVDGVPVDVKNARNSRPHTKTYVEHCVPHFKLWATL
ncbi:MAG TPA: hypothetical protein VL334_19190 [Anaerolineae bacterium]|nr:hypothetical protein [Anaerolineae bacterium]